MKKVVITQSNYIPWKGYFDAIAGVDECILYDDVQYTRRDWRNRNQIKTPAGLQWLTVPVQVKGKFEQRIQDVFIDSVDWSNDHLKAFHQNYKRSKFFDEIYSLMENEYAKNNFVKLSELNRHFIQVICSYLKIDTKITSSSEYQLVDGKTERLVSICQQTNATEYISGPAARNYLDESLFKNAGIALKWLDYSGYQNYPQLWGDFVHQVTILDLLFNCGSDSRDYMKFSQY